MKLIIEREKLLKPLQLVSGAVEKKQTLPILSNILLTDNAMTATDLEVELIAHFEPDQLVESGEITVNARKLFDICRTLPESSEIELQTDKNWLKVRSGKSRFNLATLPAHEFPSVDEGVGQIEFSLPQNVLKSLLEKSYFAMAQQDVRYYLNGMLFEVKDGALNFVATDGHRLAFAASGEVSNLKGQSLQVVVPRKGILELIRLLDDTEDEVKVIIGVNHIQIKTSDFSFNSKLIEGKFPDYSRVIPKGGDKTIHVDRSLLKQALTRVAILSNEKYRGIRMLLSSGLIKISSNNPEQEEAEEELVSDYNGPDLEIGLNVNYLLDICNVLADDQVKLVLTDSNSSILVESPSEGQYLYVVMPMRL